MRIAVLGDVHHYRLTAPVTSLFSKRALGMANLWLKRRFRFDRSLLTPTLNHLDAQQPDAILLSGDLTTTALTGEFDDIARALAPIVADRPSLFVPGNHDRYTPGAVRDGRMERALAAVTPPAYPHVRPWGERWMLLALDAARPRRLTARGELNRASLDLLRQHARACEPGQGLIVLCHYPFATPPDQPPSDWQHQLPQAPAVRDALDACRGTTLYIHGHIHRPWVWRTTTRAGGRLIDLNAGAPLMRSHAHPQGQGFWIVDLPDDPADDIAFIRHALAGVEPIAWQALDG